MPSRDASFGATPVLPRIARAALTVALVAVAAFCVLLLGVRFVVFPRVEDYRDDLVATLSRQMKAPVEIDALATGWDGWNPKLVVRGFRVRSSAAPDAAPVLELPQVDLVVAWTSLPLVDLRLKRLSVEQPRLSIRRDRAGILHIAGMELDPAQATDDSPLADWVLRQPHIAVHDAVIAWNDDLRNAPQLVLEHVNVRLDSRFGRHRFGLVGTPPGELAAPMDIRGDVRGGGLGDWRRATGKVYVRLDYADLAAFSEWLPLPVPIASGKGALRLWLDFAAGETAEVVADLELADVSTRLAPNLPPLALSRLSGRIGFREAPPRREFYTRDLAYVAAGGARLDPTDLSITLREARDSSAATGLVEFDRLQLAPLRELAVHLPLPEQLRTDLALFAPQGTLARGRILWEGPVDAPDSYSATAEFSGVGIAARNGGPGVSGITGRLELTQATGDLKLSSRDAVIDLPQVFTAPLPFDSLDADVSWKRAGGRTTLAIERVDFANKDAAGRVAGQYRTVAGGPGEIDLTAQLSRADAAAVHRYMPRVIEPAVRDWLRTSLVRGTSTDARMKLSGDLAAFPFVDGRKGQFTVAAKVRDVVLDYAAGWPQVTELDGSFGIANAKITIDATRGKVLGAAAGKGHAEIDNMAADYPVLRVALDIPGTTTDFLRFVDASPVAGWIEHLTDGAQGSGNGRLDLKLTFPLGKPDGNRIAGEYQFLGNDLKLAGTPMLSQLSGSLAFTEGSVRAPQLVAEVLGGPARFAVASGDGQVRVTGGGTISVAALRREYDPPLGETLSGTADWTIAVGVQGANSVWTVESDLKGVAIDLPAPLGKPASEAVAFKVERRGSAATRDEDALTVVYGSLGRLLAHRRLAADGATVDRALLLLGRSAGANPSERPERPGLWVRGDLAALSIDDLLALQRRARTGAAGGLATTGIDLDVGALEVMGRRFNEIRIGARRSQDDWRLELAGRELAGTATWSAPTADAPNGRIAARLARLTAPDASELVPWKGPGAEPATKAEPGSASAWPAIDLAIESYFVRGRDLGRLEFVAHPRVNEWKIDRLVLANDAGRVNAEGQWQAGAREQTNLDIALDAKEAGKFLAHFGYPDALQNAPTKIKGQLAWAGAPNAFDFPSLNGAFRIEVGPGRFTKVDPGIGKLLGVLSLQSLPRRITLDFTDVFSEGFAFDEITGNVTVVKGVLKTEDLKLAGPAAKVAISGTADLASEAQQLHVRVQPALSSSVSAGAMLLLFANPVVGAAVGAGSLLAQKVLRDPIEQMFSYDYSVTGSWSDPIVTKGKVPTMSAGPEPARQ